MSVTSDKLEPLKLFKVFRSALGRRMSGTLTVRHGQYATRALLSNGHAIRVASNRPEDSLQRALVEEGLISSTERVEIEEQRRANKRSFESMVRELGLVSDDRLDALEARLGVSRLVAAFAWPDGAFTFEVGAPKAADPRQRRYDTVEVLLTAAAQTVPTPWCERFLKGYTGQRIAPLEWASTYAEVHDRLFPPPNLRGLLNAPLELSAVAHQPGDKARNIREAAALVLAGLGRFEGRTGARPATSTGPTRTRPARPATRSGGHRMPTRSGGHRMPTRSGPNRMSPRGEGGGGDEPRRAVRTSRPPRPATVAPHPSRSSGHRAGERPKREDSGSRASRPVRLRASTPPAPPGSTRPSGGQRPVRPRPAQRPAPASTRTTGGQRPVRPPPVDRSAAGPARPTGGQRPASAPAAKRPKGARPARAAAAKKPARPMPDKVKARLDDARRLHGELDSKTHYALLGVDRTADTKAIRVAFRKLARDFHVDRFARYGLEKDALNAVQQVFIAMNRAHETLSDAARRQEYDASLDLNVAGSGTPRAGDARQQLDRALKAEKLIKDATLMLGRGEAAAALERFRKALAVVPDDPVGKSGLVFGEYLVAQAQGGSQTMLGRAQVILEEIVAEYDAAAEPFFYLGRIYRAQEENEKAVTVLQKALAINPHYAAAGSELRHAKRQLEQKSSGLAGLFGRKKK